jgi:hypothetical protein
MATAGDVERIRENKERAGIGNGIEVELITEAKQVLEFTAAKQPFYAILDQVGRKVAFEILESTEITKQVVDS